VNQDQNNPQQHTIQTNNVVDTNNGSPTVSPVAPVTADMSSSKKLYIILAITFFLLIAVAIVVFTLSRMNFTKKSEVVSFDTASSAADVQKAISKKGYFDLSLPDVTACKPSSEVFGAGKSQWTAAWTACLSDTWGKVLDDALDKKTNLGSELNVVLVDASSSLSSKCKESDASQADIAAQYCPSDATIYLFSESLTDEVDYTNTLLHEYAHAMQWVYALRLDESFFIGEVYNQYPNQPVEKKVALDNSQKRIEMNAQCVAYSVMKKNSLFTEQDRKDSFNVDPASQIAWAYGTDSARQKLYSLAEASPSMQTCNLWAMDNEFVR
jgi:hypothetical protein